MTTPLIPPGAQPRIIPTSAGRLHVLHAGPGHAVRRAPLLLVHGGGTDASAISWYHLFARLGGEREVWAVDLPGFGGSIDAEPVGGPEALAAVVAEVASALDLPPAVVVGVSMGGDVALHLALARPGAVAGLVLIGSGGLTPVLHNPLTHAAAYAATRLPDPVLVPLARLANRFAGPLMRSLMRDPDALPPEVVDEFVRLGRDPRGGMGYGRYNQATVGPRRMRNDVSPRTYRIRVPVLLVHGACDTLVDVDGSRRACERMPDARLLVIDDCGHWAQLDAPEVFLSAARGLLAEVDSDS